MQFDAGITLAQCRQCGAGLFQTFTAAIDAGVLFHRRHHFAAHPGNGFSPAGAIKQLTQARLCAIRTRTHRRLVCRAGAAIQMLDCAQRGAPAEYQQLSQ